MIFPPAILLINQDISQNVQAMLVRQLAITEVIDGYTFDNRIAANTNYPNLVHSNNQRLLIMRPLSELNNRALVDVAGFIKAGMLAILSPFDTVPGFTFPIVNLTWADLLTVPAVRNSMREHCHHFRWWDEQEWGDENIPIFKNNNPPVP